VLLFGDREMGGVIVDGSNGVFTIIACGGRRHAGGLADYYWGWRWS